MGRARLRDHGHPRAVGGAGGPAAARRDGDGRPREPGAAPAATDALRPGGLADAEPVRHRQCQSLGHGISDSKRVGNRHGDGRPQPFRDALSVAEPDGERVARRQRLARCRYVGQSESLGVALTRIAQPEMASNTMEPLAGTIWDRRSSSSASTWVSWSNASMMLSRSASSPIRTQSRKKGNTNGRTRLAI